MLDSAGLKVVREQTRYSDGFCFSISANLLRQIKRMLINKFGLIDCIVLNLIFIL